MMGDDDLIEVLVEEGTKRVVPKWTLAIPEWVPKNVPQFTRIMWANKLVDPIKGQILKRLLTDPRMKPFYESLTGTRKLDGRYRLPARFPPADVELFAEASKRQDFAINQIVQFAFQCAVGRPQVTFQHEIDTKRKERKELARKVTELADELYYDERLGENVRSDAFDAPGSDVLWAAARIIKKMAAVTGRGTILAINKSDNLDAHAYAILIADYFETIFASPHYKLTATLTAVALNLDVEIETLRIRVRDWWKFHKAHHDRAGRHRGRALRRSSRPGRIKPPPG